MATKHHYLNPFILSPDIPDEYFCDRKAETETLLRYVMNGNNILLISPRRMGKSGIIHHVFNRHEVKDKYYSFFIDIYETSSLEEFVQKLGQEIVGKLSKKGLNPLMAFLKSLTGLRGVFSLDPSTGMPSFSVGIGDITQPELTLNEIFSYLESADKPCIVAIDEFQKVADYEQNNVEAILRSKIQMMHNTTFIFSGSERSVLAQMFGSAARPFYQSVSTMSLGPIECAEYTRFAINLFDSYGKQLNEEAVESLYNLVQGYTYYLQRAMNESFSLLPSESVCDRSFVFERIDGILTSNTDTYKELLSSLTANQRALLTAIALEGKAMNITSVEFVKRHGLGAVSSVQTAARSLLKRQLITRDSEKQYYMDDKFLELWLIRPYGISLEIRLAQNKQ